MFAIKKFFKEKKINLRHLHCIKGNINDFQNLIENNTYEFKINNINISNLKKKKLNYMFKDGRFFSHFIENWLDENCERLKKIEGCKDHDFTDKNNKDIKYEQKSWTKNGLIFLPSSMVGTKRKINYKKFKEKNRKLKYIIVSNVDFPIIKIKFINGYELIKKYPSGKTRKLDCDLFNN